jgi:threonyl-tRNA synthetase
VTLDERNEKIGYKIRDWETKKIPYMLIVGEKEIQSNTVSVRQHKIGDIGSFTLEDFKKKIIDEIINKRTNN